MNCFIIILTHECQVSSWIKTCCSDPLSDVIPALVEPVDPDDVDVGHTFSLPDRNRGVGDGSYGFRSVPSKGSSTDLDDDSETQKSDFYSWVRFSIVLFDWFERFFVLLYLP